MNSHLRLLAVCIALTAATVAAYWGVWNNEFIAIDDVYYLTDEPMVTRGLSVEGFLWAFRTGKMNNYHPVTWLSYMLDAQIFGIRPAVQHTINLVFHIANSILLLIVFHRMTGAFWKGAFIAAVFALHPLHVESVAWAAERKDVLSMFFALLTVLAYIRYAQRESAWRYCLVFILLALGLLTKPMLVTFPFVLLLLDIWPLGRSTLWQPAEQRSVDEALTPLQLLLEKLPLLLFSVLSAVLTYQAQHAGGAVADLQGRPLLARALNGLTAYGRYIFKTFWPQPLAFFYPYSFTFDLVTLGACALLLGGVTILAIRSFRARPYIAIGWFWFLGTLVPVIGVVQAGDQAIADRYMYLPMVGLTIVIAWGATELLRNRVALATLAAGPLVALAIVTQLQVRVWKDSVTLAFHTLRVTDENNFFAHSLAGLGYAAKGDYDSAIAHFEAAGRVKPGYLGAIPYLRDQKERQARARENAGAQP
jgi:protein O-mannosyl-transferase